MASKYEGYSGGLKESLKEKGQRPHYIFGLREMASDELPFQLPRIENVLFDELLPGDGETNMMDQREIILQLTEALLPHLSFRDPKLNARGEREGYGRFEYDNGDVYEGRCEANIRQGYGKLISVKGGYTYMGQYVRDKRHGHGRCEERSYETVKVKVKVIPPIQAPLEATARRQSKKVQPNMKQKKKRDMKIQLSDDLVVEDFQAESRKNKSQPQEEEVDEVRVHINTYEGKWHDDMKNGFGKLVRTCF